MAARGGTVPTGPSPEYLRLLRGDIDTKEYVKSVEKRVQQDPPDTSKSDRQTPPSK